MALASDLMGLGITNLMAAKTANGGTGPITITAAGTGFSTSTRLGVTQFVTTCSTAGDSGGACISLPPVGGAGKDGCLLADMFVINNATTGNSLYVFASSGVLISSGGSNNSVALIGLHTTLTCYPISTTQWVGVRGV